MVFGTGITISGIYFVNTLTIADTISYLKLTLNFAIDGTYSIKFTDATVPTCIINSVT